MCVRVRVWSGGGVSEWCQQQTRHERATTPCPAAPVQSLHMLLDLPKGIATSFGTIPLAALLFWLVYWYIHTRSSCVCFALVGCSWPQTQQPTQRQASWRLKSLAAAARCPSPPFLATLLLTIPRLYPRTHTVQHGPPFAGSGCPCLRHNMLPRLCPRPKTSFLPSWPAQQQAAPLHRGTHHHHPTRPRHPAVLPLLHHQVRTGVARVLLAETEPGLERRDGEAYLVGRCLSFWSGREDDDCGVFYALGRL